MSVFDHQQAADKVDQHRADAREGGQDHEEPAAGHALADVQFDHPAVGVFVPLILVFLLAVELGEQLSGNGQRFVEDAVDLVVAGLGFVGVFPAGFAGLAGGQCEQRNDHDADQREDPVLLEHGNQRDHQRDDVGKDARERIGDHLLHAVDVAGHAGNDIALVVGGEETLGHLLQVGEHLVAHVKGNVLRDPRIDVAFRHTDQVGTQRHRQGHQDIEHQRPEVALHQAFVDDFTGEDRRKQGAEGRRRDAHDHQQQVLPVRLQVGKHAYQQFLRYLRLLLFLLFGQEFAHRPAAHYPRHANPSLHICCFISATNINRTGHARQH